jgi:tetratricopeptide (TPR) repeat protein
MTRQAEQMVEEKQWPEVKIVTQRLLDLYPDFTGPDSPYRMLSAAHRALGETNAEREALSKFAERDDEAADAYLRLMELCATARDWPAVAENARRYLAVDPLAASPYRFLAQSSEQTGDTHGAITAYGALLELGPPDPAEVHFRLAELLHRVGDPSARRHVLQALEDAPRFQDALRLLLKINNPPPQTRASSPTDVNATP